MRPSAAHAPERAAIARSDGPVLLDDFEQSDAWRAQGSDDVSARSEVVAGTEGRGLALHFDFQGHGGYAGLRRALPLTLPANYELSFDLRGDAPINDLQFKLSDESGENVWWFRKTDLAFPKQWQHVTIKKRQIEFAWGPTKDRELKRAAHLEFVVYAGREGGAGTFVIDQLRIRELPPPLPPPAPIAVASSHLPGNEPGLAVDGVADTAFRCVAEGGKEQVLELDLGVSREFGGLTLRWLPGAHASSYEVELSRDREHWQVVREVRSSNGGLDAIALPESEARYLRLRLREGPRAEFALGELEIEELAFGATPNAFVAAMAKEAPRGRYPRGFRGEQPYWTIVGADGAAESGLLSEDGALEAGVGGFSVEPFVIVDGQVVSWAEVDIGHALADGYLPVPSATWRHPAFELAVSAFAAAQKTSTGVSETELWGRYDLTNVRTVPVKLKLVLAVRPYQVNPPTQFLNVAGGVSPIDELQWDGRALLVNGARRVVPLTPPDHVGLATFDGGGFPESAPPAAGRAPLRLRDPQGLASGALVYELTIGPRQRVSLGVLAPLMDSKEGAKRTSSLAELERTRNALLAQWREKLGRVDIRAPTAAQPVLDSLRSALAHVLVSRAGEVLRPGTRSYSRSWIRDGAMMAEGLLRLGHEQTAREYLEWFAPYQFANGKVPCCVDRRGADPVVENDSAGEFLFLVAEVYRYTRDRALLERMWPHVEKAARYMDELRLSERTERNREAGREAFYGLMPPSISHEGYSDRPAYSYWDDFWALIGYEDAAFIAGELGREAEQERFGRSRDEFRADLLASLRASAARHRIDYIPGSADRGDFDGTSTTIALSPGRVQKALPEELLTQTFERYYREFIARRDGSRAWKDYTPYELRVVATFVRLGQRERAHELLDYFFRDQRPAGWNQWAEVVGRDPREPRFIGDMPHAWIASDYIRSALELFAYARVNEQQLVIAAGIPLAWFEGPGVRVQRLRTPYGLLKYAARKSGKSLVFELSGATPPGGFVIPWPWSGEPGRATANGQALPIEQREVRISRAPARVALELP